MGRLRITKDKKGIMKVKNKKILMIAAVAVLALATVAGCGKKEAEEKAPKVEKEEVVELNTIGTKADDAFMVKLTNATGQDITAVSIKSSSDEAYPENMMEASDKFVKDETREVYYKPSEATKSTVTEDGKEVPPEYLMQITLEDGKTYELHAFPFEDMEEGKIELEGEFAYLTYTSTSTKEDVNTLDAEKAVKAAADAKAKAEAEAKAKAEAEAAAAAAAAEEAANQENYYDNSYDSSYDQGYDQGYDDGCVGDGLTY